MRVATLKTVSSVDLQRYSGKWYEIARYPNWFQRKMRLQSTAEYAPQAEWSIKVTNTCLDKNGKTIQAIAMPDGAGERNAKLKVSFFGPFTATTGSSRSIEVPVGRGGTPIPQIPLGALTRAASAEKTYQHILEEISRAGYDTSRLIKVSK